MRHIKGVGIGIISFVLLFLLIGLILPNHQIVTRDLWLKTSSKEVVEKFEKSSSWMMLFPDLIELDSSSYTLSSTRIDIVGSQGKEFEFLRDEELLNKKVGILQREKNIKGIEVYYQFSWTEPDSGSVRMTLDTEYRLGSNPFYRFVAIGFDDIMDGDIQRILKQVKTEFEN